MIDIEDYIRNLRGCGFFLRLENGKIRSRQLNRPMTDDEFLELKERKPDVMAHLVNRLTEDLEDKYKQLANARETYERFGRDWPSIEKRWREECIPQIQADIAKMQAELSLFGVTVDDPTLKPTEDSVDEPETPAP
jgi:hypothetical protein